jgi:gluconolactonase
MQAFRDLATTGFALSLFASVAFAQSVVELPANLADPGTQVVNVLTQDPRAGQNNRNIGFSEGPAVDSAGNLYFSENVVSELNSPKIWKVTPTGTASVLYESSIATNGLEFDPQGRLLAVANGMVLRFYPNGTRDTLIRNNILVNLNDLSINSSGYVLLTNYTGNKLFLLAPGGVFRDSITIPGNPNGVEFVESSANNNTIYLNLTSLGKVVRFNWSSAASAAFSFYAGTRTDFIPRVANPDGITVDSLGNFYIVSNSIGTVVVYSPAGDSIGRITVKARSSLNATNCTFGGPGNRTLFITGNGGAYKVQMKVPGRKGPGITTAIHSDRMIRPLNRRVFNVAPFDALGRDITRWRITGAEKIRILRE